MFDPTIFDDDDAHGQMPDWFAHLLVLASYALAFWCRLSGRLID